MAKPTKAGKPVRSGLKRGKLAGAEAIRRLAALYVTPTSPLPAILRGLDSIARTPPDWADTVLWDETIARLRQSAQSFGGLDVWLALENAPGNQRGNITLHTRTLPDLRAVWMPRMGLTAEGTHIDAPTASDLLTADLLGDDDADLSQQDRFVVEDE